MALLKHEVNKRGLIFEGDDDDDDDHDHDDDELFLWYG